jgi:hypothetical protein
MELLMPIDNNNNNECAIHSPHTPEHPPATWRIEIYDIYNDAPGLISVHCTRIADGVEYDFDLNMDSIEFDEYCPIQSADYLLDYVDNRLDEDKVSEILRVLAVAYDATDYNLWFD